MRICESLQLNISGSRFCLQIPGRLGTAILGAVQIDLMTFYADRDGPTFAGFDRRGSISDQIRCGRVLPKICRWVIDAPPSADIRLYPPRIGPARIKIKFLQEVNPLFDAIVEHAKTIDSQTAC